MENKNLSMSKRIHDLSQKMGGMEALARVLRVSYYTVSRWHSGKRYPQPYSVYRIEELERQYGLTG